MRVLITNQHTNNRGDESAVIGLVQSIRSKFGSKTDITILKQSGKYKFITDDLNINEEGMLIHPYHMVELLFWIIFKKIGVDIRPITTSKFAGLIDQYDSADLVLSSCGGPYIGDLYINHEFIHLMHLSVALLLKKKVYFSAPSMGPFNNILMNPFRRRILKRVNQIILRDPISYEYVKDFGIDESKLHVTVDACLAHHIPNQRIKRNGHNNYIGITPLDYGYSKSEKPREMKKNYQDSIIGLLDDLMEKDPCLQVMFFPQLYGKHTDVPYINHIIDRMKYSNRAIVFSDAKSGPQQQEMISHMKYMIATRYHSAIFACKMRVPCLCIAYEHKAKGFMELLDLNDYCIDIYDVSKELLEFNINMIKTNYELIIKTLNDKIPQLEMIANKTIDIIGTDFNGT